MMVNLRGAFQVRLLDLFYLAQDQLSVSIGSVAESDLVAFADAGKLIRYIFACVPSFATVVVPAASPAASYTDIAGHWARSAIIAYADPAVFSDSAGKFLPAKAITRAEFVLMLHKALGISIQYFRATDIKDYFTDVSNGDRYASALYDLATMNIIDYRGAFRPNAILPRDEMVHIVMNALKNQLGGTLPVNQFLPKQFSDDLKISEAFKSDVYRALLLSLINGRGNNIFDPKTGCTRAEAAVMMERLAGAVKRLAAGVDVTVSAVPGATGITMNLSIINNSAAPVTLDYTSGQRYDFALLDAGKADLYRWSADKQFIQALSSETLAPGQSLNYSEVLSGDVYLGIKGRIAFMTAFITGQSASFAIDPSGYQIPVI